MRNYEIPCRQLARSVLRDYHLTPSERQPEEDALAQTLVSVLYQCLENLAHRGKEPC